jgi:hypothetical protein
VYHFHRWLDYRRRRFWFVPVARQQFLEQLPRSVASFFAVVVTVPVTAASITTSL